MTGIVIACLVGAAFAAFGALAEAKAEADDPNWPDTRGGRP